MTEKEGARRPNSGEFGPELEGLACHGEVNDGPFRCPEHQRASGHGGAEGWVTSSERLPELRVADDGLTWESAPVLAFAYLCWPPAFLDADSSRRSQVVLMLVKDGSYVRWKGADDDDVCLDLSQVTHWRPLPAPPGHLKE